MSRGPCVSGSDGMNVALALRQEAWCVFGGDSGGGGGPANTVL